MAKRRWFGTLGLGTATVVGYLLARGYWKGVATKVATPARERIPFVTADGVALPPGSTFYGLKGPFGAVQVVSFVLSDAVRLSNSEGMVFFFEPQDPKNITFNQHRLVNGTIRSPLVWSSRAAAAAAGFN